MTRSVSAPDVPAPVRMERSRKASREPAAGESWLTLAARLTVLALVSVSIAGVPSSASSMTDGAAGPTERSSQASVVRLLTGDVVRLAGSGVSVEPAETTGVAGNVQVERLGGSTYVFPAEALPYLGRYLDPELFNVTRLAALGGGRTQVRLHVEPGSHVARPGVTVTSRSAAGLTGYLTRSGSDAFRDALVAKWTSDQSRPGATGTTLFAGITMVAPMPGVDVEPPVAPTFPQQTLSMRVLDADGAGVPFTTVALANTDDGRRYAGFVVVVNGRAKVSVPFGDYSAETTIDELGGRSGRQLTSRTVIVTDYRMQGAGQTLVLDARKATSRPSVRTPRPAGLESLQLEWARTDRRGIVVASVNQIYQDPRTDVRVTPAPAARIGQQHWFTTWALESSPVRGPTHTYDLVFDDVRVAADQARVVRRSRLTTVHARYFADGRPRVSLFGRAPLLAGGYTVLLSRLPTPTARTEQVLSPSGTLWTSVFIGNATTYATGVGDGWRRYPGGAVREVDWLHPALLPGFAAATRADRSTPAQQAFACPACRVDGKLVLHLSALTDSTPAHSGSLDLARTGGPVARLRLYRDGHVLADDPDTTDALVNVPAATGMYRLLFHLDRASSGARRSSATTELTFASSAGHGPAAPHGWTCNGAPAAAGCRVLPVLQVHAPLPLDLDGQLPATGEYPMNVVAGHLPGARQIPITYLSVQTRSAGGTWTRVPMSQRSEGHYHGRLGADGASPGAPVDLRIIARDAAGGTLRETVRHAYTVSQS